MKGGLVLIRKSGLLKYDSNQIFSREVGFKVVWYQFVKSNMVDRQFLKDRQLLKRGFPQVRVCSCFARGWGFG